MSIENTDNNLSSDKGLNITSFSSVDGLYSSDDYSLSLYGRSCFNSSTSHLEATTDPALSNNSTVTANPTTASNGYSLISGYGSINAAAAVAQAVGQNPFTDVANLSGNNWGADMVKAPEVWAQGYTGQGVVVAVLDTGVDYTHEDLQANIWTNTKEIAGNGIDDDSNGYVDDVRGWNFDGNNNDISDIYSHGTHVSGTIAGVNNNVGVTGIAYNAKIMPVKVLNDSGTGSYSAIANGIYYAVNNGADVINLSLGGDASSFLLDLAIDYASSQGVIVVMAAGNESASEPSYPARYADERGIAVGAVDKNNNMAEFSNKAGAKPLTYVTAPGVEVYSTLPDNSYASYSGTSMATPHVAGVVALMLSANKSLTDAQVRQIVTETALNNTPTPTLSLDSSFVAESSIASFSSFNLRQYEGSLSKARELVSFSTPEIGNWASKIPVLPNQWDDVMGLQEYTFNSTPEVKNNEIFGNSVLNLPISSDRNTLNIVSYSISDNEKDEKDKDDSAGDIENILKQLEKIIGEYFGG
ncbi:hypothetical protein NUACC21_43590 [Scytonema sp. NUACC21]